MFVQVGNVDRRMYFGTCIGNGYRTSYEMVHLKYTPHECNHVQGMINVFQEKLVCFGDYAYLLKHIIFSTLVLFRIYADSYTNLFSYHVFYKG